MEKDTIVACSTALPGAIGVIRISGQQAVNLLESCFHSKRVIKTGVLRPGTVEADGIRDTAMAVFLKSPDTFTGEDTAEIYIHGSIAVAEAVLRQLTENGARPAEAGEFTRRAFLNGKLDLSEAEGVINMINAVTQNEAKAAYTLLSGGMSRLAGSIQDRLRTIIAAAEAVIDYPEEDLEETTRLALHKLIEEIILELNALKGTYKSGRMIKDGIRVVLCGPVNVGKSMLLNALLGRERAIVTPVAGTTRDVLEDSFQYNGYRIILSDTAGLRDATGPAEKIGVKKALEAIASADVVIAVSEYGKPLTDSVKKALEGTSAAVIYAQNKCDKAKSIKQIGLGTEKDPYKISATKGFNLTLLKDAVINALQAVPSTGPVLTELRHYRAVSNALEALESAATGIQQVTMDCTASDLLTAYDTLGQITGRTGFDEIIDEIFSKFCVGK